MATLTTTPSIRQRPALAVELVSAEIRIHGTAYHVEPLPAVETHARAFRLNKLAGDGPIYDVVADELTGTVSCDCPAYTSTHEGTSSLCKHGRALTALGLLPAPCVDLAELAAVVAMESGSASNDALPETAPEPEPPARPKRKPRRKSKPVAAEPTSNGNNVTVTGAAPEPCPILSPGDDSGPAIGTDPLRPDCPNLPETLTSRLPDITGFGLSLPEWTRLNGCRTRAEHEIKKDPSATPAEIDRVGRMAARDELRRLLKDRPRAEELNRDTVTVKFQDTPSEVNRDPITVDQPAPCCAVAEPDEAKGLHNVETPAEGDNFTGACEVVGDVEPAPDEAGPFVQCAEDRLEIALSYPDPSRVVPGAEAGMSPDEIEILIGLNAEHPEWSVEADPTRYPAYLGWPAVTENWRWAETPAPEPERLTLLEVVTREAARMRAVGNGAHDLMGQALETLAATIRAVGADHPADVSARVEIMEQSDRHAISDWLAGVEAPEIGPGGRIL